MNPRITKRVPATKDYAINFFALQSLGPRSFDFPRFVAIRVFLEKKVIVSNNNTGNNYYRPLPVDDYPPFC